MTARPIPVSGSIATAANRGSESPSELASFRSAPLTPRKRTFSALNLYASFASARLSSLGTSPRLVKACSARLHFAVCPQATCPTFDQEVVICSFGFRDPLLLDFDAALAGKPASVLFTPYELMRRLPGNGCRRPDWVRLVYSGRRVRRLSWLCPNSTGGPKNSSSVLPVLLTLPRSFAYERSASVFFFIFDASSTILRIASARDGRSF